MGKFILRLSMTIFSIMLLWIVSKGIIEYNKIIYDFNPLIVAGGVIAYMAFLVGLYKWVIPKIASIKWIKYGMYAILCFLLIFCGIKYRINPSWDMGEAFNIAKAYVTEGKYIDSFYLAQFPNNIMMTIVDIVVIKACTIVGVSDFISGITVVNAVVIFISIVFACITVKKLFGEEKSIFMLITCILCAPFYWYAAEYYTDTYSILPTVLLLFLYLKINEKDTFKRKIIWQVMMAFVLFFAVKIKITAAFVLIAIVIFEICNKNIKKTLINLSIVIPICAVLTLAFNYFVVPKFVSQEEKDLYEIPKYHWIMMGMEGLGDFSYKEYAYTQSFKTLDERNEADIAKIKERIRDRSISTHIRHISDKLCFAWQDGTYQATSVVTTEIVQKGRLHELIMVSGKYNKVFKYIPQVMHYAMLILIIINVYCIIKRKQFDSKDIIAILSVFGLMLFLIMWENRSRYVFTMIFMMLISQINGVDYLASKINFKRTEETK